MVGTSDLLEQVELNISIVEETLHKYRALASSPAQAGVSKNCTFEERPIAGSSHASQNTLYPVGRVLCETAGSFPFLREPPNKQDINSNHAQPTSVVHSALTRSRSSSPCPRYGGIHSNFLDTKSDDWSQRHNEFCLAAQRSKRDLSRREHVWRQQCNLLQSQVNALQADSNGVPEPYLFARTSHTLQHQTKPAKVLSTSVSRRILYNSSSAVALVASGAVPRARSLDARSSCPILATTTNTMALVTHEATCASPLQHPRSRIHRSSVRLLEKGSMSTPSSICCPGDDVKLSVSDVCSQRTQTQIASSPSQLPSSVALPAKSVETILSAKSVETILCGQDHDSSRTCLDSNINALPTRRIHDDIIKDIVVPVHSLDPRTLKMGREASIDPISEQSLGVSLPPTPVMNVREFTSPHPVGNMEWPIHEQQELSIRVASLHNAIVALTDHVKDSKCQQKKVEDAIMEIDEQVQALHHRIENDVSEDISGSRPALSPNASNV